jgi:anti-sigma-K factor RskA
MSRTEDRYRELCAAWVLGALEGDELREFEVLLRDPAPHLKRIFAEFEHAALHLPLMAPLVEPPTQVKAKLMEVIRSGEEARLKDGATRLAVWLRLHRPRFAFSVTLTLTVLLVGLSIVSTVLYRSQIRDEQRIAALVEDLEGKEQVLQILQSKTVEVVFLDGLEINPRGYGKIIWDTENRVAVLQVSNLPPVPENKVYQLWVYVKDREPTSAGVFALKKPARDSFFRFGDFPSVDRHSIKGFVITLEPEGGVPQPSGEWYVGAFVPFRQRS